MWPLLYLAACALVRRLATGSRRGCDDDARDLEILVGKQEFVSVRLTPDAYAHGLAVALPELVEVPVLPSRGRPRKGLVLARPTVARTTEQLIY